ncbi:MAG: sulfotransferase domain-containing protein [Deltaproteobacteria bacterium]|nr:sulfotransferase domain-containing protein [Deltaproteobacteria bacterium]MBW2404640.1 sulfotransferase domain-containing protein [Deltaproteobacteria bacterium]MBW2545685.1 sulfotransferase domain-containing protein [Deltaproteobacteria bacterium]MBW2718182.1 sulfotransferase domain-containing protein [Deltaproteobacteria bacterium]
MSRYPTTDMCHGALLEAFEPTTRASDVFCATAAKCGQTWLMTLMHHLRTRGQDPNLGGGGLLELTPWLELPRSMAAEGEHYQVGDRLTELEAFPDPRVFKMHVLWDEIPRPAGSRSRVVTITRDPRDVPYSMFRHTLGSRRGPDIADDFDAYFNRWMKFGYYFKVVRSFWPHRDDPLLLWLRYEDLQRDLEQQAWRLVRFLGWPVSEAEMAQVLPLVSFDHMRASEDSALKRDGQTYWKEGSRFFREGGMGKNRSRLSDEQERRLVDRVRAEFEPECGDFVMSLGNAI